MTDKSNNPEQTTELAEAPAPGELVPADAAAPKSDAPDDPSASCDSACGSCQADCSSRSQQAGERPKLEPHATTSIGHIIAVVSGKGGVGKSLVATSIAAGLHRAGKRVGVLDADITGPSMARAFGVDEKLSATKDGILPSETPEGVKLVSTNLVLPDDQTPVLWRGAVISGILTQFFQEVLWGELDYLVVDMPPGTGDVPLTVFQSFPIDGIVIVTAPQDLVGMIVGKALNMAEMMDVPVLGIVQNMAYFQCPGCGERHDIFGSSDIDALASEHDIKLVGKVAIDPSLAKHMDEGRGLELDVASLAPFVSGLLASLEASEQ